MTARIGFRHSPAFIDQESHTVEVVKETAKCGDLATHRCPTKRAPPRPLKCCLALAKEEIDISGRERLELAPTDPVPEGTDNL